MSTDDSESGKAPEGWASGSLGSIADIRGGIQKEPKRTPKNHAYRYLRVANVLRGRLELKHVERMELFGDELRQYRLAPGDILVVEGNGSLTEIGRSALWRGEIANCVHQNHIIRVRSRACLPEYLDYFWNSPFAILRISAVAVTTSGLYSLSTKKVAGVQVQIAPLAEQRRIVEKVEALLARVNAASDRLAKVPAILKRFRQSVLAAACSGRLTEDWRERGAVRIDSEQRNAADDCVGTWSTPHGWTWRPLASLLDPSRAAAYGVLQPGPDTKGGVSFIRVCDIQRGEVHLTDMKRIAQSVAATYPRTKLKGGELLVTLVGTIGRTALVPVTLAGANVARAVGVFPLSTAVSSRFVQLALEHPTKNAELVDTAREVARKTLNLGLLKSVCVPVPLLAEQNEIARRVDALFAIADTIERRVEAAQKRADRLSSAALAKAFRGELVPTEAELARQEGREYESAEQLLKRVRGEVGPAVRTARRSSRRRRSAA